MDAWDAREPVKITQQIRLKSHCTRYNTYPGTAESRQKRKNRQGRRQAEQQGRPSDGQDGQECVPAHVRGAESDLPVPDDDWRGF